MKALPWAGRSSLVTVTGKARFRRGPGDAMTICGAVPAAAGGPGVISVRRVDVALSGMAATRSGGLSDRIGSVVRASVVAGAMVVEVGETAVSRRGAVAWLGWAPTACGEVTLAAVGPTSLVLGQVAAALDRGAVVLSGVAAAGCTPVAVGVGEIVESTVGEGVTLAADDGVDTSGCGY